MVWKQSRVPSQALPNPEEYKWKLDANEEYEAVTATLPPCTRIDNTPNCVSLQN